MTRRSVVCGLVVLALGLCAMPSWAQEAVSVRFYVVPRVNVRTPPKIILGPKYIDALVPFGVMYSAIDYGKEDTMLVGATVTPAQHIALVANLDVLSIPQNLDGTISAVALSTMQDSLEGIKVPGSWLTSAHTYRDAVRIMGKVFLIMQRFDALNPKTFFDTGITLGTTMGELTANQKANLQNAALDLGLDVSALTNTTTVRSALRQLANQLPSYTLMGETF